MIKIFIQFTIFLSLVSALPLSFKNIFSKKDNLLNSSSNSQKYWYLPTKKIITNSYTKNDLIKRDNEILDLSLTYDSTFYFAEVAIGSNSQKVDVLLDTGSSDFWLLASNNSYCESGTTGSLKGRDLSFLNNDHNSSFTDIDTLKNNPFFQSKSSSDNSIDCSIYGTYDSSTSTTFTSNNTLFSISYADGTFAKGTFGQDTVTLGNTEIKSMNFAVCDNTDNNQGVLGIGLAGLEVTSTNTGSTSYEYQNLPLKLVSDGLINKAAYSVYLDNSNSHVLFGAIDSNKYQGDLVELPIVNALFLNGYGSKIQFTVTINEIDYIDESSSKSAQIGNGSIAALLDTGTTLTYAPSSIVDSFVNLFGLTYSNSLGYYVCDCSIGNDSYLRINFQGLELDIPFSNFLLTLSAGSTTSSQCAFGIVSSSDTYITLGQSFLQSVYMVANLEDLTIALAKSSTDSSTNNIVVIDNDIPNAISPASSITYGTGYSSFTILSTPSSNSSSSSKSTALSSTSHFSVTSHYLSSSISSLSYTSSFNSSSDKTSSSTTTSIESSSTSTSVTNTISSISSATHKNFGLKLVPNIKNLLIMLLALI
ncbi:hypothetical protein C6P40_002915 [Pichia californica]|uniref:candidapepsin n=1 Tax=Pichia californica TaxID=460514 RepID=A0A9P7BFD7_9ASCO|nr:hypothetical protein C6P40_002915 [[Candida] californica]